MQQQGVKWEKIDVSALPPAGIRHPSAPYLTCLPPLPIHSHFIAAAFQIFLLFSPPVLHQDSIFYTLRTGVKWIIEILLWHHN